MEQWLQGAEGRIGEREAQAFRRVAALVEMLLVEEGVELCMEEGLHLSLAGSLCH
jgi:hypothetical protein